MLELPIFLVIRVACLVTVHSLSSLNAWGLCFLHSIITAEAQTHDLRCTKYLVTGTFDRFRKPTGKSEYTYRSSHMSSGKQRSVISYTHSSTGHRTQGEKFLLSV